MQDYNHVWQPHTLLLFSPFARMQGVLSKSIKGQRLSPLLPTTNYSIRFAKSREGIFSHDFFALCWYKCHADAINRSLRAGEDVGLTIGDGDGVFKVGGIGAIH